MLKLLLLTASVSSIIMCQVMLPERETIFVSKMQLKKQQALETFKCECDKVNEVYGIETECRCFGKNLLEIPSNLSVSLDKLVITDADLERVTKTCLEPYRDRLKDIHFINLPFLKTIEEASFSNIRNLRTIYISHAPLLTHVPGLLVGVISTNFLTLRIIHSGLIQVPNLSHIPASNTLFLLDLDHNKIDRLPANAIKIKAEQVTLNFNQIRTVDDSAFNGSQIGKLNIQGNRHLSHLSSTAFRGLQSLRELDLSQSALESLPVIGLSEIESLRIEKTPSMKTIPSIYDFPNLQEAKLTHPFHCCAFKYPQQHDPERHAKYAETIRKLCEGGGFSLDTGQPSKKIKRQVFDDYGLGYENLPDEHVLYHHNKSHPRGQEIYHHNPIRGETIQHEKGRPIEESEDDGFFHSHTANLSKNNFVTAFCGNFTIRKSSVKCSPEPNALNPCEDIMGSSWLRVSVWFVVVLAILGNSAVIFVGIFSTTEMSVSRFLICNLALADFCMGIYLLFIAYMDLHSVGTYFNFAFNWQYGPGCQVAGFLTVFSSHLSIFTLTVVTLERWFAITNAMHLTRRIRIGAAAKIMFAGWIYSICIAMLPLFGISNYSSTSICLPMEVNQVVDKAYLYAILLINGVAFALIVFCYAQIYLSLGYETRRANTQGEMTIAKKMALLVFTDFATWAPIAFFGLTALAGYPLIDVTESKILLVFFYPLNACANPYLYALMTAQYRQDLLVLLTRCGFCKRSRNQDTITTPLPSNNALPLLAKINGRSELKSKNKVPDTFV